MSELGWVNPVILTARRSFPVYPQKQTITESVGTSHSCHHRKSVDFSITSSVHSSLREHLGSISNACEVLVWPQYGTDRIFGRLFLG